MVFVASLYSFKCFRRVGISVRFPKMAVKSSAKRICFKNCPLLRWKPFSFGWALRYCARFSIRSIYSRSDRGHPCLSPLSIGKLRVRLPFKFMLE